MLCYVALYNACDANSSKQSSMNSIMVQHSVELTRHNQKMKYSQ